MTLFYTPKRKRAYRRSFDYEEARALRSEGLTYLEIGRRLGVKPGTVERAVRLRIEMQEAPFEVASTPAPGKDRCPTCQGWKTAESSLCQTCYQDSRLAPPKLKRRRGRKGMRLGECAFGRVVNYRGHWAVVEPCTIAADSERRRLCFWDGPAEIVSADVRVDVAPYLEIEEGV